MSRRHYLSIIVAAAIAVSAGTAANAAPAATNVTAKASIAAKTLRSGLDLEGFDRSVRPQDDLYRFAGGTWLAKTEIPADRSNFGTFSKLEDDALAALRELIEAAAADSKRAPGSDAQKLGDFYTAFMNTELIEKRGLAPLTAEFGRIEQIAKAEDVFVYFGRAQRVGLGAPVNAYVGQDRKQSSRYIPGLSQSGLTMPDREYYLADDARNAKARADFAIYAEKLLSLAGTADAAAAATRILALETAIAKLHWTRVENRDPVKTYNRMSLDDAATAMPAFEWRAFIGGMGPEAAGVVEFDIRQPTYVRQLGELVRATPVASWREYFRFRALDANAAFLPQAYDAARFEFRERALRGVQEQQPRWRRGLNLIDRSRPRRASASRSWWPTCARPLRSRSIRSSGWVPRPRPRPSASWPRFR
jgi:putative endopeptidase